VLLERHSKCHHLLLPSLRNADISIWSFSNRLEVVVSTLGSFAPLIFLSNSITYQSAMMMMMMIIITAPLRFHFQCFIYFCALGEWR